MFGNDLEFHKYHLDMMCLHHRLGDWVFRVGQGLTEVESVSWNLERSEVEFDRSPHPHT